MNTLLRKFADVSLTVIVYVFAQHLLNYPQAGFVVNLDSRLRSLKGLDSLDSDPVFLVFKFPYYNFFEYLKTSSLLEESKLVFFSNSKLVTK